MELRQKKYMYSPKKIHPLRFLLLPFSLLYGIVIHIRNYLFDKKLLSSAHFSTPTICVGNISVGGTGKTPMTEMLIESLSPRYKIATLSRGYRRKTKGFLIANNLTTTEEIGDEPMQFHIHYPHLLVSVGEDRRKAIQRLEELNAAPDLIILDDALQHRKVIADCNILLTDYHHLFTDDYFLPTGTLRDQRSSVQRANIIIVTKCPSDLSYIEKKEIENKIRKHSNSNIYFSSIIYGTPYNLVSKEKKILSKNDRTVAIAGIANPIPYFDFLNHTTQLIKKITLPDHYDFTEESIQKLFSNSSNLHNNEDCIYLVTEKDAVKLSSYQQVFINLSIHIYILPIKCIILYNESDNFLQKIIDLIDNIP